MFAVGAAGGFVGSRLAATPETTATIPATTTTTLTSFDDLTDAEKVWCEHSTDSYYAVAAAAHTLGYWDSPVHVWLLNDSEVRYGNVTNEFWDAYQDWEASNDYDWEYAHACRGAFEAR
jgi:hypothetical protein